MDSSSPSVCVCVCVCVSVCNRTGNTNDLYYHSPSNTIASNYSLASKAAAGKLFETMPKKQSKDGSIGSPYPAPRTKSERRQGRRSPTSPLRASGSFALGRGDRAPTTTSPKRKTPMSKSGGVGSFGNDADGNGIDQLVDAVLRYQYYIEEGVPVKRKRLNFASGEKEDVSHIAPPREEWIETALSMVPQEQSLSLMPSVYARLQEESIEEIHSCYYDSMKKSIVDYALMNPFESDRLDLEALTPLLEIDTRPRSQQNIMHAGALPPSWISNVTYARENIAWTLQTLCPQALSVAALWEDLTTSRQLLDLTSDSFCAKLPFDIEDFKHHQAECCEKAYNVLWTVWVPKTIDIFVQHPPLPIGDDVDSFYRCISTLQSNQLRGLVQEGLDAMQDFFAMHMPTEENRCVDPLQDTHMWSTQPVFKLKLEVVDSAYVFKPSFWEVEDMINLLFDQFVLAVSGIPRVGSSTAMSGQQNKRTSTIPCATLDEDDVVDARKKVMHVLDENTHAARELAGLYDKFEYLLETDISSLLKRFKDVDEATEIEQYSTEIDKYLAAVDDISNTSLNTVRTGLYLVDCESIKTTLITAAKRVSTALVEQMMGRIVESNTRVCESFSVINSEVMRQPTTGEEVLELKKYIRRCSADMEQLEATIRVNHAREDFLNKYIFEMPDNAFALSMRAYEWPKNIAIIIKEASSKANEEHRAFEDALKTRRNAFADTLSACEKEIESMQERGEENLKDKLAEQTTDLVKRLADAQEEADEINAQETLFGWPKSKFVQVAQMQTKLDPFNKLWTITSGFSKNFSVWMNGPFSRLDPEKIDTEMGDMYRTVYKLVRLFSGAVGGVEYPAPLSVAHKTKDKLERFKQHLPLISAICNKGLRERHWEKMSDIVGFELRLDDYTTLSRLLEQSVDEHIARLEEISDVASREWTIEKTLDKMLSDWDGVAFELNMWKATGTFILKGGPVDEAQMLLDDHLVKTQAMSASPFAAPFTERLGPWEYKMTRLQDILDEWLKCQGKWIYLEPIFGSEEIMAQIPTEGAAFREMDKTWRSIMTKVKEDTLVLSVASIDNLLEDLVSANASLDIVEKGLNDFLDTKKMAFPRFYFLSNDELLEILSEAKDPVKIQPFVKKCFEAVKELEFTDGVITSVVSPEGEKLPLIRPIDPAATGAVEKWMLELEQCIKDTLHRTTKDSVQGYAKTPRKEWILEWPGQLVLNVGQIYWTKEVGTSIQQGGSAGLKAYGEKCTDQLKDIVELVRGELTKLQRSTLGALVVIDVHARDVTVQMAQDGVDQDDDFKWLSQLRYYWEDGSDEPPTRLPAFGGPVETIKCRMINAQALYGFEYIGNSGRLVITPLTDRCYRTLMGAIHMCLGGAPAGPAGTGKTETTKDLSKAIAIMCVVFNCSDQMDYKMLGKFFKGLSCCGAWACFDEFNRIELEVLSVVAQQVLTIQRAVAANTPTFIFEGVELKLKPTVNVFITMNPGYAGRSELPDNLKALFRDVAMMVPDYALIAEIILYSNGYLDARAMARKLVQTYRLCSEQLSSQDHYDYGMRAVMSVLRAAGNLKRTYKDEQEDILMLRAIKDVNLPKFLDQDVPLFQGILSDLFPGVSLPESDYKNILEALAENSKKLGLQPLPSFFEKCIQLYEMIIVRHGLMLVGESFGMKSSAIKVLAMALSDLNAKGLNNEEKVKHYFINPKSVTMGQLYGQEDPVSKEWTDGVLAVSFRNACRDTSPDRKWVVLDGPVDAIWIENMNTVLDDNKKLCLTSGEIIAMSGLMNMIFEVEDLAVASPATVSRCGMVYVQSSLLGWRPVTLSWLDTLPEGVTPEHKEIILSMFDWLVPPCLRIVKKMVRVPLQMNDINLVQSSMRLYESLLDEFKEPSRIAEMNENLVKVWLQSLFLFSLVWGIGAIIGDVKGRSVLDKHLRKLLVGDPDPELKPYIKGPAQKVTQLFPDTRSVYDFKFDKSTGRWVQWMDTIESTAINPGVEFTQIIVPTTDTVRFGFLIKTLLTHHKNTLMVGPTGTGKTAYVKKFMMEEMDPERFVGNFMNFSAQTSANMTQDIIDGKLDKRRKGVYGPPHGKRMVLFVDDLNMPQVEVYGAQPPIELLRQFIDYQGWYDRKELTFRKIVDTQLVSAMGPPGGGRNAVTNRFTRHFSVLVSCEFEDEIFSTIFGSIVQWWMKTSEYGPTILSKAKMLVSSSIEIYNTVSRELLPTPTKSHYTFNLRDLSKVFQGLCRAKKAIEDPAEVIRLWIHEVSRVFKDRLTNTDDRDWLNGVIEKSVERNFKEKFTKVVRRVDMKADKAITMKDMDHVVFADYLVPGADPQIYDEVPDLEKHVNVVQEYLGDYNAMSKKQMPLVLFEFALEHVSKICRIIRQTGGHALLVGLGGSGRQSLTKLAAFMEEYEVFQIEVSQNYGNNEWHDDMKKCLRMAGEQNKPTVFLFSDTQIKDETFVEDISNILNTGDIPNLFDSGDMATIGENIRSRAKQAGMDGSRTQLYNFFISEVRRNLHVVLAFSPIGDSLRDRIRRFPSLVNCCTIDWFSKWPREALEAVATHFLVDVMVDDEIKQVIGDACVFFHQSTQELSQKFFDELRRHYYVTPSSYLELINAYKSMLQSFQERISKRKKRYEIGLEKLYGTEEQVHGMQKELEELQPQLKVAAKETEEAMTVIASETVEADKVRVVVKKEEDIANKEAAKVQAIKDDCQADLDEAMPLLNDALRALDTLTKNDITEVKGMKSPPAAVKLVMEAVCIMKGLKPTRVKDASSGKMVDDFWETSKKMITDTDFLNSLKSYDKDNIPASTITKIRTYVSNPEFEPAKIKTASQAAFGLCCWVRAMEAYDRVAKIVGPKKIKLGEAEAELEVVMAALREKQANLKEVEDKIGALNENLAQKEAAKAKLEADVELCTVKLDRAQTLIGGLGGEKSRWEENKIDLGHQFDKLAGDILISAGVVAYLGCFTSTYRKAALHDWCQLVAEKNIPASAAYNFVNCLGDPVKIRQWNIQGLPKDEFSTENAISMVNSRRWPLCIDPQGLANKWIRKMEQEEGLLIMKMTDKDYMRKLENCIQFGKPYILENIGEELDASIEPLLLKQIFKQSGVNCIKIGDNVVEYSNTFRFYMTSKLRNPHYSPEICTKVALLNFVTTPEGLQDQLLGIVVAKERPDLEEEKSQLIIQGAENKKKLQDIENKILEVLSSSEGNILEDNAAVEVLSASKTLSDEIKEKQKIADATELKIDEARSKYTNVARHTSTLFFCVSDMGNIDPMYQYSLGWFVNLYERAIDDSEKSSDIEERITMLNDYFTYFLFVNVCRSLFEKDKLLFAFVLTTKLLLQDNVISAQELRFLLTGGVDIDNPHPNPAAQWLSGKAWGEICRLNDLKPSFHGIMDSFVQNPSEWRTFYDASNPLETPYPDGWGEKLTGFEKMIFMRCIRPDKLVQAITAFVETSIGKRFVEPLPFDLAGCYEDSRNDIPLIFVLSQGSDPMAQLLKFADDRKVQVQTVSLGQGQGPVAKNFIDRGVQEGFWVVLQNCHLAKSFLPTLEVIFETQLASAHKDFRLWLTSYPSPIFPISILENGVKMTNEAPKGLRAGLLRTYNMDPVPDEAFFTGCSKDDTFRKMLYGLAFFHAYTLERKKYGPIGWNIPYEFNENDLRISVRQLRMFLDEYDHVPYETLKYTCGECNYGGRVTDGHDRHTLMTILDCFYNEDLLEDDYRMGPDDVYAVPGYGDYKDYIDFINAIPLTSPPECFGLHENANISKDLNETNLLLDTLMMTQSTEGSSSGISAEDIILSTAEDILSRVAPPFDLEVATEKYPVDYHESMNTVLTQELVRFNALLVLVHSSLNNLVKAVKGLVLMSADLDAIGQALLNGKVPEKWKKRSFASMKPLGPYIRELTERVNFFQSWIDNGSPNVFWISGFFFTQAFLTGSKQNYARKTKIPIDAIDFTFQVMDQDDQCTDKPEDGVYCKGLFFDGCAWDSARHVIGECLPKVLYTPVPIIWMRPAEVNSAAAEAAANPPASPQPSVAATDKTKDDDNDGDDETSVSERNIQLYECPLYKTWERRGILSTTGHSTNFVMDVKLPTDVDPSHWTKRGACMLCALLD